MKKYYYISLLCFLLTGCSKNKEDLVLPDSFYYYDQSQISLIDTLSVKSGTYRLDSVFTSGTNRCLLGTYYDSIFGSMSSHSYMEFNIVANTVLSDEDVYDSIQLLLKYDGYYYGDTNVYQTINIYRLKEDLVSTRSSGKYSYDDDFNTYPNKLGTKTFKPSPQSNVLPVSLDKSFGNDMFDYIKKYPDSVYNYAYLLKDFHGIKMESDTAKYGAVVGFKVYNSAVSDQADEPVATILRIYYHTKSNFTETKWFDLAVFDVASQYNRLQYSNTKGNSLKINKKSLLDSQFSADLTYLQSGTGIVNKLEIPNIKELTEYYGEGKILGAYLQIFPQNTYYDDYFSLPDTLYAYNTDKYMKIGGVLTDYSGSKQNIAILQLNEEFPEQSYYLLDITGFLTEKYETTENNTMAIFLTIGDIENPRTVSRLVLGSFDQNKILCKIYYLRYKK